MAAAPSRGTSEEIDKFLDRLFSLSLSPLPAVVLFLLKQFPSFSIWDIFPLIRLLKWDTGVLRPRGGTGGTRAFYLFAVKCPTYDEFKDTIRVIFYGLNVFEWEEVVHNKHVKRNFRYHVIQIKLH